MAQEAGVGRFVGIRATFLRRWSADLPVPSDYSESSPSALRHPVLCGFPAGRTNTSGLVRGSGRERLAHPARSFKIIRVGRSADDASDTDRSAISCGTGILEKLHIYLSTRSLTVPIVSSKELP